MPMKGGRFTAQEQAFVKAMAETGDKRHAEKMAGYKTNRHASQLMTRPAVQQAIRDAELAVIHNELLPLSNHILRTALTEGNGIPWGARMKAVEIVHKRVFGEQDDKSTKALAEMTPAELDGMLESLQRELAERATPVLDLQADTGDSGVFE